MKSNRKDDLIVTFQEKNIGTASIPRNLQTLFFSAKHIFIETQINHYSLEMMKEKRIQALNHAEHLEIHAKVLFKTLQEEHLNALPFILRDEPLDWQHFLANTLPGSKSALPTTSDEEQKTSSHVFQETEKYYRQLHFSLINLLAPLKQAYHLRKQVMSESSLSITFLLLISLTLADDIEPTNRVETLNILSHCEKDLNNFLEDPQLQALICTLKKLYRRFQLKTKYEKASFLCGTELSQALGKIAMLEVDVNDSTSLQQNNDRIAAIESEAKSFACSLAKKALRCEIMHINLSGRAIYDNQVQMFEEYLTAIDFLESAQLKPTLFHYFLCLNTLKNIYKINPSEKIIIYMLHFSQKYHLKERVSLLPEDAPPEKRKKSFLVILNFIEQHIAFLNQPYHTIETPPYSAATDELTTLEMEVEEQLSDQHTAKLGFS